MDVRQNLQRVVKKLPKNSNNKKNKKNKKNENQLMDIKLKQVSLP